MSENEDERLDRAKRIRKMREGGGEGESTETTDGDGGEQADETDVVTDTEGTATDDETERTATDVVTDTEKTATDDETSGEPAEDAMEEAGDDAGDEPEEGTAPAQGESDAELSVPEATVPEMADLELDEAERPSLEAEDDVRAPLPDSEALEEALESSESEADTAAPAESGDTAGPAEALEDEGREEETRVLEFKLADEYYCLDITYIEEIVKDEPITRVPNTPEYVEGVVDLRGQITTMLNPKVTIEKDDVTPGGLIIVFDSDSFEDQGHVGWVVDDVRQVSPITDDEVNDSPVEEEYINGVIDREDDDQFVIWTDPDMAMEEAE